jgi:diguanylate cyclase (GGDEF)-like protein
MPGVAMKVLELSQQEGVDIAEIAKLITKDAALSSKILRTVNSSFYARSQKVSTISHAMVILGLQSVKTLVLGFSLVSNLSTGKKKGDQGRGSGGGFDHQTYWKRSIYAATAARTIAGKAGLAQSEECFLAALLMDIGMMVFHQTLGDRYAAVMQKAPSHETLAAIEDQELGMNHAEAAGVIAEHWKLPPALSSPMAHHHAPQKVADEPTRVLAKVVRLAGRCADVFVEEGQAATAIKDVRALCQSDFGMGETADVDLLMDEISHRTAEAAPLFDITIGNDTYEAILKRANEQLIELTLSTQRQAAALSQTASTLAAQNEQLKAKATIDGLTGLANRAAFDRLLEESFAAAQTSGKPLALLLLDLDHFKSINDTHGHQAGDMVLRTAAQVVKATAGRGRFVCRYGGEEIAVIVPGAAKPQAAAIAESIRKAVAGRSVAVDKQTISATASIGMAVFEPGGPLKQPAHLLKAADMAVYAAKKGGRNCVKVFAMKQAA